MAEGKGAIAGIAALLGVAALVVWGLETDHDRQEAMDIIEDAVTATADEVTYSLAGPHQVHVDNGRKYTIDFDAGSMTKGYTITDNGVPVNADTAVTEFDPAAKEQFTAAALAQMCAVTAVLPDALSDEVTADFPDYIKTMRVPELLEWADIFQTHCPAPEGS